MTEGTDLASIVREAEDRLFSARQFDAWERSLYYHLLRRTHVDGVAAVVVAIDPLAKAAGMSSTKVREILRSLHEKGCVCIEDRSRTGHSIRVRLPVEILGPPIDSSAHTLDPDSLDFFTGRRYVDSILAREAGRCFYCLREIATASCTLDHVVAQVNGSDHSFRNVVASCHTCNTTKQEMTPGEFLRQLYRRGVLAAEELESRIEAVERLQAGLLRPTINAPAV